MVSGNALRLYCLSRVAKYWLQACSMETNINHEYLHELASTLTKDIHISVSHYLIFRKWIAGWIENEKAVRLY